MIHTVGAFEKVSYPIFSEAMRQVFPDIQTEDWISAAYEAFTLPQRATSGSAGYDFTSPISFTLAPRQTIKIPTGIRVKIEPGWWLGCLPRSGLGFQYRLQLDNTMGVIDSDYYYSDNEGQIFVKITNDNHQDKTVFIQAGDRFMQGIFLPYGIAYNDCSKTNRNGGLGSTGMYGNTSMES